MQLRKPLLGMALLALTFAAPLRAEVVSSPAEALRLMTEARVAAEKCNWLKPAERRELTDYAARAELVAVRREGTAAARNAVKRGRAAGSAGCSAEKKELVLAVLQGARNAVRRAAASHRSMTQRTASPQPRQVATTHRTAPAARSSAAEPRPQARVQRVSFSGASTRQQPRLRGDVAHYRRMAASYYHALKCRNRPQGELMRMWRQVRDLHFAILRAGHKQALARAKAAARTEGNARSCR